MVKERGRGEERKVKHRPPFANSWIRPCVQFGQFLLCCSSLTVPPCRVICKNGGGSTCLPVPYGVGATGYSSLITVTRSGSKSQLTLTASWACSHSSASLVPIFMYLANKARTPVQQRWKWVGASSPFWMAYR